MANFAYLDVEEVFGEDGWTVIDRNSLAVELATKHLSADRHAEHIACEFTMGVEVVNAGGSFEDLKDDKVELKNKVKPRG